MEQWAKRPPLKLEVPGSNPRGWFNGRAGNRDPCRWLETARGLSPIRLIGRAQYFPGGLAASSLNKDVRKHTFAVSAVKHSLCFVQPRTICPGFGFFRIGQATQLIAKTNKQNSLCGTVRCQCRIIYRNFGYAKVISYVSKWSLCT